MDQAKKSDVTETCDPSETCREQFYRAPWGLGRELLSQQWEPFAENASIFENISESPTLCTGKCSWSTRRRLMARGIGAEMRTGVLMRVVPEPRLGLRYADEQGFKEARYEVVQFCRRQMGCAGEGRSIKQGDVESSRGGNDRACQSSGRGRTVSRFGFFAIASSTLPEHLGNLHRISTMLNRARMTIRKMSGKISKETTLACD